MRDITIAQHQEAIVAQCTPIGPGALALVRLTGHDAVTVAQQAIKLASGDSLTTLPTHTIHYGRILDAHGASIDNVLVLLMRGPKTFTGQDTVEITCHNNQFIVEQILEVMIAAGARLAHNGEFSYRAVLNNKIDVIQAESINELIHANTQMSLKHALHQVNGSFSQWIAGIEKQLIKAIAFCEASFEFIDEEMGFDREIKEIIVSVLASIDSIKSTYNKQHHIRQGIRVAIIGSVNVGKSSLFNVLLKQNRSIVTHVAGTTRDVIEAGLYKGGHYWTLIDTAGLRQTEDIIEQEGIERSREQAELADIILLVFDGSRELTSAERDVYTHIYQAHQNKIISVCNKIDILDIPSAQNSAQNNVNGTRTYPESYPESSYSESIAHDIGGTAHAISTKTQHGITQLHMALEKFVSRLFETIESPFLLNKRHYTVLLSLEQELRYIQARYIESTAGSIGDGTGHEHYSYELISYHLVESLAHLAQLTGKSISEQGMDAIFKEFCVGK